MIVAQDPLDELEFSSTDSLENKLAITRVIEEGTTLTTRDQFC